MPDFVAVKTALVSVSDRAGLADFCAGLAAAGVKIIATDSTGRFLAEHGVATTAVAEVTGFPEMLDGRVKTLHPRIHGGILANRDDASHLEQLREAGIDPIDLVVVNLYPFREAAAKDLSWPEVIEQIDIGGPSLIRASAKNHTGVGVMVDPDRYGSVLDEIEKTRGLSHETRRALAAEAFAHTAAYDASIAAWMARGTLLPDLITIAGERVRDLRYGENPHQQAALYAFVDQPGGTIARAPQLQGKDLSYNNILDIDAAWAAANDFGEPACAIIKHAIPCGLAQAPDLATAYSRALESDTVSAFGGVIAVNRTLDGETARRITEIFTECVAAPALTDEARAIFAEKPNVRVLEVGAWRRPQIVTRHVSGGLLVQEADDSAEDREAMRVVTKVEPSPEEWSDLLFGWRVVKHVRSNAIVFAKGGATIGIGGGQTSRVDSVEIAAKKAGDRARGAVMASDAFFPFRDGVDAAAAAGITAVIQPGGSVRDDDVIAAADEHGIAMVLTGVRHFRHG
ncbi:MAG: bifunctional phosphoribosylaminoimidazolecarboxamide formyltransferase/IMP cyclohydrolase [Actinomycetota bacterium]|nr:bifunctional phosphoribosylaminoimidazolecarboxamide formyltransferase/IMP cyclohydrolase [Actinomycetota bacterium]